MAERDPRILNDNISASAYNSLSHLFEINQHRHLEIEILPSAIQPPEGQLYLQEDKCIGIPKRALIVAFQTARSIFTARIDDGDLDSKAVFQSTYILLLYDPEYLTAANYRKRRLRAILKLNPGLFAESLLAEMNFLSSILTSPLHRQSKSPTLWYHRWWLISVFIPSIEDTSLVRTISVEFIHPPSLMNLELECVFKAAERHPNNYYAWQHARRTLLLGAKADVGDDQNLKTLLNKVLPWCLRNPSDTSGWSFLLHLLGQPGMAPTDTAATLNSVLIFATQLKWQKEALWVFVRAALCPGSSATNEYQEAQMSMVRQLAKHHELHIPYFGKANPCCTNSGDGYWGPLGGPDG